MLYSNIYVWHILIGVLISLLSLFSSCQAGDDGSLKAIDYVDGVVNFSRKFNAALTRLVWLPKEYDAEQRTLVAGFADGVIRLLIRCSDGFKLISVLKPHKR